MRRLLPLMFLLAAAGSASAQPASADRDNFAFTFYLVGQGLKEDAVVLARHWPSATDSACFAKGYAYYSARLLDSAAAAFGRVAEASPLHAEALFFAALSQAHLGHADRAAQTLGRLASSDPSVLNLKRFEQAGVSLLRRDLAAFDHAYGLVDTADYRLSVEAQSLLALRGELGAHRAKSPFVAGALSALLPGLGKVYAGSYGEGVAAFLLTGSLAAVTAENWVREGPANWKTIVGGLLAALFYAGNVYGSAVGVRALENDFNRQLDVQVLYDIHIPLRNSYRR